MAMLFLSIIWLIFIIGWLGDLDLSRFGVHPKRADGLPGILFAPFIHEAFTHILSNTLPFFILILGLFYFYPSLAWKVFLLTVVLSGTFVWLVGSPYTYHFGASGLIYAFAAFLFFSGVFRKNVRLMAISAAVYFLYGGMFWGILPGEVHISWESHLGGFLSGLLCAVIYRRNRKDSDEEFEVQDNENDEEHDQFRITDYVERKNEED
jgi:membrane associated rhomboid family serine protease